MKKTNLKGFTLIELLVVIAIIGLLSTLAVVALNSARQKSRDSKRVADVKQIQTALELYYADQNGYPATATAELGDTASKRLCAGTTGSSGFNTATGGCTGTATVYMGLVPKAPLPADTGCADNAAAPSNKYLYTQTGTGSGYTLSFCLGGKVGDLIAGAHTADANGIN
ncbi:prepilin-type N-terminal cleavage/methylation domain-containing protein [Candidatus Uhrbacteria bacterium]|nr:prepilin-type N-terminal cleavage/methylation domain-containing protein [Candidatus Uhrbacteria bacterium]